MAFDTSNYILKISMYNCNYCYSFSYSALWTVVIGKLDIFHLMYAANKVWFTELTLIHKHIRSVQLCIADKKKSIITDRKNTGLFVSDTDFPLGSQHNLSKKVSIRTKTSYILYLLSIIIGCNDALKSLQEEVVVKLLCALLTDEVPMGLLKYIDHKL